MNNRRPMDWNQLLHSSLDFLLSLGDVLMLVSQTVIVALGVPVVLVLAVVVEQQRVKHGIELFEKDPGLAALGSWVLVVINLVFEFQAHHIEHRAGYKTPEATEFSLRVVWDRLVYMIGFGSAWQARQQSPAKRYYEVGRIVTIAILTLALAGSMREQINEQTGTWYEGLVNVVTKSTLLQMSVWAGGLLFAFAAVMSAQASSRYIATRVVEIRNSMTRRKSAERQQPMQADAPEYGPGPRPVWGDYRRADLQPLKVKIEGVTKYQCPSCEKTMSRQAWANHPCRLTAVAPSFTPVDTGIDGELDAIDVTDKSLDVNQVNAPVNAATDVKQSVKKGVKNRQPTAETEQETVEVTPVEVEGI